MLDMIKTMLQHQYCLSAVDTERSREVFLNKRHAKKIIRNSSL